MINHILSERTHDLTITLSLHQNDTAASFWRKNDVVFPSCVCRGYDWHPKCRVTSAVILIDRSVSRNAFRHFVLPGTNDENIMYNVGDSFASFQDICTNTDDCIYIYIYIYMDYDDSVKYVATGHGSSVCNFIVNMTHVLLMVKITARECRDDRCICIDFTYEICWTEQTLATKVETCLGTNDLETATMCSRWLLLWI